jgi:hypothetical protein
MALAAIALVAVVGLAAAGMIGMLLHSDWGAETLRRQAEQTVRSLATGRAEASVGPSHIALGSDGLGFELTDVVLTTMDGGAPMVDAGRLSFGLRIMPLMTGNLQLGTASISGARVNLAALQSDQPRDWTARLRDASGLIDPDLVAGVLFESLYRVFDTMETGLPDELLLNDVDLVLPQGGRDRVLRIVSATLSGDGGGDLRIDAELSFEGRRIDVAGLAVRDAATRLVSAVDLAIDSSAPEPAASAQKLAAGRLGAFRLAISGVDRPDAGGAELKLSATVDRSVLDLGARGAFSGQLQLDATLANGSGKLEIDRLLIETGGSSFDLNGAVGPRPASAEPGARPLYRFEFVSSKAVLAPEGSKEPPLDFAAQLRGTFDPETGILTTDDLAVRTDAGTVLGKVEVDLEEGLAPGIAMTIGLRDMPVSQIKQLWPWFSAPKARQWVFDHLSGGQLREADVQLKVASGRLGNGVPLSAEEIVGRFVVAGTRFNTVATMPPVSEADGVVDVRGHDVDITLDTGTIHLPGGGSVTGTNGTFRIGNPRVRPLIAKLSVDVAGDARSLAEFAAMKPIDAFRRLPFTAEDVSGAAAGHVDADIPLQKGVDPATLDWKVDLDFTDLAIAKPIGDQTLSDADGHLSVVPAAAKVEAKGMLNGIPATINLSQPLRGDGEQRRDIELVLDDAARRKLAPGLDLILSGTTRVEVEESAGVRHISADLTDATVTLPWVGWSKGKGVAASAQFSYAPADGTAKLSNFEFVGNSFSAAGELSIAGGELVSARFDRVRLNRGDDARVVVERGGGGYRVAVSGKSLDARSVIKTYLSPAAGSEKRSAQTKVSLEASLDNVVGFHGESLAGVTLKTNGQDFSMSGSARSGRQIVATREGDGARTSLNVQADDGGALLRFLDVYDKMQGGTVKLVLAGADDAQTGQVDIRDFLIVDEPRLASVVSTTPSGSDRSLGQAVRREIDTTRVQFERGYAQIDRGPGRLRVANGVVRGPVIGTTFQGTVYDTKGRIDMTGTFMPAYGINRIFGELPLVGALLGNGRDGGLIGVTFKLDGEARSPRLQVNPLSIVAPGIFRQIFEF